MPVRCEKLFQSSTNKAVDLVKQKCYLTNHIDQVEELTEEELGSIPVVLRSVPVFLRSVGREGKIMMSTLHGIEKSKNLNIHDNETFQSFFSVT